MESVRLTFQFDRKEYVKAVRRYLFACRTITKRDLILLSICLPASILYQYYFAISLASFILFLNLALPAVAIWLLYFVIPPRTYKRTAQLREEYTYVFTLNYILVEELGTNSEVDWETYVDLWESEEFYFLMKTLRKYTIIPKRAFGSPEEKKWFERFASMNLSMSKRLL